MSEYDVVQVCPNGHVANESYSRFPQFNKDYCEDCGEKTITTCPSCEKQILGRYSGSMSISSFQPPAFCRYCGSSFPWTKRKITAAIELATEIGGLAGLDAEQFKESVNEVVRDTPRTQVSASRLKGLLVKVGEVTAQSIRDIIVDITSETAKKLIWPGK